MFFVNIQHLCSFSIKKFSLLKKKMADRNFSRVVMYWNCHNHLSIHTFIISRDKVLVDLYTKFFFICSWHKEHIRVKKINSGSRGSKIHTLATKYLFLFLHNRTKVSCSVHQVLISWNILLSKVLMAQKTANILV